MKNRISLLAALALLALPAFGQNRTSFGGESVALDFAYGVAPTAAPPIRVLSAPAATGAGTLTLSDGFIALPDGTNVCPLSTTAPVLVGGGSNQETVTPTAFSCGTQGQPGTASITATFANLHGTGDPVASGTFGLQEAINFRSTLGGVVVLTGGWNSAGGTNAIITAATPFPNVYLRDNRGAGSTTPPYAINAPYWTDQPTTLTVLTNTVALTSGTAVFGGTGTWSTTTYYLCYTYVDQLGGESTCSPSFSEAGAATSALTVTAPAAKAGAVGWRMYGGITSTPLAFLLPITAANCTLTTGEFVMPACAIGSNGTWTAIYTNNNIYSPVALGVTNTKNQVPQSHTTFGYQPSGTPGQVFQTHYGPFGSGTIASATATDITPLATINLPAGFLSSIGRTVRIRGKIQGGETSTGVLAIFADLSWALGETSGLGTTVCNPGSAAAAATVNYTWSFECILTTNAVGTTTSGSIQADSWFLGGGASGTGQMLASELSLTAYTTLNLNLQDTLRFYITPTTEAITAVQMMSLDVEVIQ